MQIRAPFAYSIDHYLRGGRKRVSRTLIDHVEWDVPEISAAEAPVAVRWQQTGRRMDGVYASLVRCHEGQFYESAVQTWRNQGLAEVSGATSLIIRPNQKSQAAAVFTGEVGGRHFDAVEHHLMGRKPQKRPDARDVEFELCDDHDERRAAAEARLERVLLIDGDIWRRIHEPTLAVTADGPSVFEPQIQRIVLTVDPRFATFGAPPDAVAHRIDQEDRWDRYRDPVGKETLRICSTDIRVEMPEAFGFDPIRNAMLRAVEAFVSLFGPEIHEWDHELISAYVGIRDRLRSHLASPSACAIEDIVEEVPPLLARLGRRTEAYRTVSRACDYALAEEPSISIEIGTMA